MKQFWMVWRYDYSGPTYKHDSEQSAITEAERLARIHPGESFVVMEAVAARKVSDMHAIDLRSTPDEIPF